MGFRIITGFAVKQNLVVMDMAVGENETATREKD